MKRIYKYIAALALTFGLTAGIYAGTVGVFAQGSTPTEVTDGDETNGDGTADGGEGTTGGGETGGGETGGETGGGETGGETGGGETGGETGGGEVTPPPHEMVGDGTFANPFTIEDINSLDLATTTLQKNGVWVKACVYGYVYGATFTDETIFKTTTMPEDGIQYNYVLVDAANTASASLDKLAPAKLGGDVDNSDKVRQRLNLGQNPSFLNSQIWLYGDLSTYKGVNGLINVNWYSLDGTTKLPEIEPEHKEYQLWVGGTQVTSDNANGISNGTIIAGKPIYNESTNTLILKDVTFRYSLVEDIPHGIESKMDGLTIQIEGRVSFSNIKMTLNGKTKIKGVNGGKLLMNARPIRADGADLTFEDVNVDISPGSSGIIAIGGTLKFVRSNIVVTGCAPVMQCRKEPEYDGCRIVTASPSNNLHFDTTKGCYIGTKYVRDSSGTVISEEEYIVGTIGISTSTAPVVRQSCELRLNNPATKYTLTPSQIPTFSSPKGVTITGYDGVITYSSSNPSVISVNSSTGQLSFNSRGSATITVAASSTDKYLGASVTYTIVYGKNESGLAFECGNEVTIPVAGYAHLYGLIVTKATNAMVTLSSNNPDVVLIDGPDIHIGAAGIAVVTATVPENDTYLGGTATCTVHVVHSINSDLTFNLSSPIIVEVGHESEFVAPKPTVALGYSGKIRYTSNNKDVAEVDEDTGAIKLKAPGTVVITARAATSGVFIQSEGSYTIQYRKANATLSFQSSLLNLLLSQGVFTNLKLHNPTEGVVTYKSNKPSIVSVDSQTGTLTLLKTGTVVISATIPETEKYLGATATCEVVVSSNGTEVTELDVLPTGLTFEATGGKKHIKIRSDRSWTASAGQGWLSVTPNSGGPQFEHGTTPTDDNYELLTVVCNPNTDPNARDTNITIKAGSEIRTVKVVQNGTEEVGPIVDPRVAPKLAVSPETISLEVTRSNVTLPALVVRYKGDDNSEITFESTNTEVLKVDEDNNIHVVGQGEAVLKVLASGTEFYKPAEATVTINAKFPDPDLVEDIKPLAENVTVDLTALAGKDMSTGGVLDNIYYSMDTSLDVNDGYSEADGCIVLNSTMTDEQMEKAVSQKLAQLDEDGKFRGIILKVPAGVGTITIDYEAAGHYLTAKVGTEIPTQHAVLPRATVDIPYNVTDPTLVYIYATAERMSQASPLRSVRRVPQKKQNSVLIYGITVKSTGADVENVKAVSTAEMELFTIGGQRIARQDARNGVFVGTDGSKHSIK